MPREIATPVLKQALTWFLSHQMYFLNNTMLIFFSLQAWSFAPQDTEKGAHLSRKHVSRDAKKQQHRKPLWWDLTTLQKHFDVHWIMFSIHFFKMKQQNFDSAVAITTTLLLNYIHTGLKPLCKMDYTWIWRCNLMTMVHYSNLFIQHAYNDTESQSFCFKGHLYQAHSHALHCMQAHFLSEDFEKKQSVLKFL